MMRPSARVGSPAWLLTFWVCFLVVADGAAADFPLVWRWSNPAPHGNNINDMAYTNGFLVQVTERGQIYTTGDLQTWIPRDSHTRSSLRAVNFFNGSIVIAGESGTILFGESAAKLQLIQLATSDWLEGVAASPSLIVAVGDNAAIYTSNTGTTWQRQSAPFTNWLRSVTYGTAAGRGTFVTVGEGGLIATSANGISWQRSTSPVSQDLNRVIWSNGQFWVVGDLGRTLVSDSGVLWQSINSGATNVLNSIASTDGSTLLAGATELRLQEARGPWSNELAATKQFPAPNGTFLSAAWIGESYFVGGLTGMLVEGFKTNRTDSPTFWLPVSASLRNWLWDVVRMPNLYLAVGDRATLMSSLDGLDWQQEVAPETTVDTTFLGVGGSTNLLVAVGSGGSIIVSPDVLRTVVSTNVDGTIMTNQVSALGIEWHAVEPRPTATDLQGVTFFKSQFVVTGAAGTILTSPNGTNWTRRTSPTQSFLSSVDSFPGGVVAVGDRGTILTSSDGIVWSKRFSGTTNWLYRVRNLGGKLITVGQNGVILTSADGVSWSSRTSGTTRWLNDVEFLDNSYFIVGNQGTVLASTNGTQWTNLGTITTKSLFGAASSNGQLIAVGVEGIILRTQVIPIPTPVTFLDYPHNASQNAFLFAGHQDQRFTLDRSTNLVDWVIGSQLEITDRSGTLLHLDEGTNSPTNQFFRTRLTR